MKYLLSIVVVVGLAGCGVVENMSKNCGGDELCMLLFGRAITDQQDKDSEQDKRMNDFYAQLHTVQTQQNTVLSVLTTLSTFVHDELYTDVVELSEKLTVLQFNMVNGYYTKTQVDSFINTVNLEITDMMLRLATLEGYDNVVKVVSPCGLTTGWYEVLLYTSGGHILGYFEQDNKRFLTPLESNKSYTTTDGRGCTFTIQSGGNIPGSSVVQ